MWKKHWLAICQLATTLEGWGVRDSETRTLSWQGLGEVTPYTYSAHSRG